MWSADTIPFMGLIAEYNKKMSKKKKSRSKRNQRRINLDRSLYCKNCFHNRKGFTEVTKNIKIVNEHLHIVMGFECHRCGRIGYGSVIHLETIKEHGKALERWSNKIGKFLEEVYEHEHPKSARFSI